MKFHSRKNFKDYYEDCYTIYTEFCFEENGQLCYYNGRMYASNMPDYQRGCFYEGNNEIYDRLFDEEGEPLDITEDQLANLFDECYKTAS